jgi:nicotinate-nucleotide adenylyltransferase
VRDSYGPVRRSIADNRFIAEHDMRLGVLGGAFDPIHNAHLGKAAAVARLLGLDRLLLVPTGEPWHRAPPAAPAECRYAMAALAARTDRVFRADRIEIDRPGPTYSVDTLRELRTRYGPRARLFLVMGADAFAGIRGWHRPDRLAELAELVVCSRAGSPATGGPPATRVTVPIGEVSSTMVRDRVRRGLPIGHLVPPAVAAYIREHRLYRTTSPSTSSTAPATRSGW